LFKFETYVNLITLLVKIGCMNIFYRFFLIVISFLLFTGSFIKAQNNFKSEDDLKKQAEKLFEEIKYNEALLLYSQLLSMYQKDPNYNYKYGTCLLYATEDKEKPLMYLSFAAGKPNVDNDVFFHFGRALQLNYRFEEAITNYQNFKKNASAKSIALSQVDVYIENCNHGKELLSQITKLQVLDKKDLKLDDFFISYDLDDLGGKLVVKPEDFLTAIDVKKQDQSLMYIVPGANEYYFSSYGENEKNSRDIYKVVKLPSGEFSKPINLGPIINTNKDENFPFMHPNGRSLYFCSKGHNSMGGYDIFKSDWDPNTSMWTKPINLDFAINSPDDDIMFITNKNNSLAYFASTRSSIMGRTHIYKIKLDTIKEEILLVLGKLNLPSGSDLTANIQVRDLDAKRKIIGVYQTNPKTGQYVLNVPNGGNIELVVEAPKYATLTRAFEVPKLSDFNQTLKQEITQNQNDDKSLVLVNHFDEKSTEEDRNIALAFIKQSANLDVNYDASIEEINKTILQKDSLKSNETTDTSASTTVAQKVSENKTNTDDAPANQPKENDAAINQSKENNTSAEANKSGKNLSETDLVNIAYEDAKETQEDAAEIKNEAVLARQVASKKKQALTESAEALASAKQKNETASPEEKEKNKSVITDLETKNNSLEKQVEIVEGLAAKLEESARKKQAEADADLKYANDLETAVKSKTDKAAITRLIEQRKQIEENTESYSADKEYEEAKDALAAHQQDVEKNNSRIADLTKEVQDLESEKNQLTKEQGKTKDKTLKQTLTSQITEIEGDQQSKRNQIITAENKNKLLKLQIDSLSKQVELVNDVVSEIKNENAGAVAIEKNNTSAQISNNTQTTETTSTLSTLSFNPSINKKTKDELSKKPYLIEADKELAANKNNTNEQERLQNNVKTYRQLNTAIDADLQLLNANTNAAKTSEEKIMYNEQIKELTALKENANQEISKAETTLSASATTSAKAEQPTNTTNVSEKNSKPLTANKSSNIFDDSTNKAQGVFPEGSFYNGINYTSQKAAQSLILFTSGQKNVDALSLQVDSLKTVLIKTNNEVEKAELQKQIDEKSKKINEINVLLAEIVGEANKRQYEEQEVALTQVKKEYPADDDHATMASLQDEEAQYFFKEARTLREQTKSTEDVKEKESMHNKAYDYEKRALAKQAKAYQLLTSKQETVVQGKTTDSSQTQALTQTAVNNNLNNKQVAVAAADTAVKQPVAVNNVNNNPTDSSAKQTVFVNNNETQKTSVKDSTQTTNQPLAAQDTSSLKNKLNTTVITETNNNQTLTQPTGLEQLTYQQKIAIVDSVKQTNDYKTIEQQNTEIKKQSELTETIKSDYNSSINKYNEQLKQQNKAKESFEKADSTSKIETASNLGVEQQRTDSLRKIMQDRRNKYDTQKAMQQSDQEKLQTALSKYPEVQKNHLLLALNGIPESEKNTDLAIAAKTNNHQQAEVTPDVQNIAPAKTPDVQNITSAKTSNEQSTTSSKTPDAQNIASEKASTASTTNKTVPPVLNTQTKNSIKTVSAPTKVEIKNNKIILPKTFEAVDAFFEKTETAANSKENPIPIDITIPEGLIFKVQIGAFRNPIPQDLFKGFNPVTGEKTATGIIRYTAGFFKKFSVADQAKNEIQSMGYRDAFVVAFYNGKRISVNEALALSKEPTPLTEAQETVKVPNPSNTTPIAEVPVVKENSTEMANTEVKNTVNDAAIKIDNKTGAKDLNSATGLAYTVQIGVYRNAVTSAQLYNVIPIYSEVLPNGLIRYTSGLYAKEDEATLAKNKIVTKGIADAFVIAFYNGKRISVAQARSQAGNVSQENIKTNIDISNATQQTKLEESKNNVPAEPAIAKKQEPVNNKTEESTPNIIPEKVIIIPDEPTDKKPVVANKQNETNIINNTPETPDTGVVYKVQMGAFRNEVPNDMAILFLKVSAKGVGHYFDSTDSLTHYTLGKVRTYHEANDLKQYAVQDGIEKPFVTAYKDGIKIDIETAKSISKD